MWCCVNPNSGVACDQLTYLPNAPSCVIQHMPTPSYMPFIAHQYFSTYHERCCFRTDVVLAPVKKINVHSLLGSCYFFSCVLLQQAIVTIGFATKNKKIDTHKKIDPTFPPHKQQLLSQMASNQIHLPKRSHH